MDDSELVQQVLHGNLGAYADLFVRYTAQIAAICRAYVLHWDVTEDLVANSFVIALERIANLRDPACFGPWLYAIARNLCRDWLNDSKHQHSSLEMASMVAAPDPADGEERQNRMDAAKDCIHRLPLEQREVIELYYGGGRITYQEIADRLDLSFGKVNQLLTRARKAIRACLECRDLGPQAE